MIRLAHLFTKVSVNSSLTSCMVKSEAPVLAATQKEWLTEHVRFTSRKGKREKRMEKRRKRLLAKQANPWVPRQVLIQKQRDIEAARAHLAKRDVQRYPLIPVDPEDDVYMVNMYRAQCCPLEEGVAMMRTLADPTMYDCLSSYLYILLDLNMRLDKKNKYVSNKKAMYRIPHFFDEGETRRVVALTKDESIHESVLSAGAVLVGGLDILDQMASGALTKDDYDYLVATPDIMPEMMQQLNKQLKGSLPSPRNGTVSIDLATTVDKFYNSKYYNLYHPLEDEHHWGQCKAAIGTLDMEDTELRDNVRGFIHSVCSHRPARLGQFVTQAMLLVEETKDELHLDFHEFLPGGASGDSEGDGQGRGKEQSREATQQASQI